MIAYVPEDIIRGEDRTWVERGYYDILRRFDNSRWIIILPSNGVKATKATRILTLVDATEIMLSSNSGYIPEGA